VLGGVALFLIGGLGLAVFCVADNRPAEREEPRVARRRSNSWRRVDWSAGICRTSEPRRVLIRAGVVAWSNRSNRSL